MRPPGKLAHSQPSSRIFSAKLFGRADRLELDEVPVRIALFFDIAQRGDASVLKDQNFVAGLIDIAQQVRRDQQADAAFFADLFDDLNHALAGHGIEPVRRLVKNEQLGTMRQRLRQLDKLLHAQGIGADLAVANFAQAHVEQSFMRALQGLARGSPASSAM